MKLEELTGLTAEQKIKALIVYAAYGYEKADKFILAIVLVDGKDIEGPSYVRNPFTKEPDFGVASINYDLAELLARATEAKEKL